MQGTTPRSNPLRHWRRRLRRQPLLRLLAINLTIGIAVAALLLGGLLALNPFGLRDLILRDGSPGTALGLLLFGFVVTFGSTAMGTAVMAMGRDDPGAGNGGRRQRLPRAQLAPAAAQRPAASRSAK